MKLFRQRKGIFFNLFLVVFLVFFLVSTFIGLKEKADKIEKEVGESSLEAIIQVQEGSKALIFLDYAAKMALYQALFDLESGKGEESACGYYYGFSLMNSPQGKSCFPSRDDIELSLKKLFVSNLIARVASYPSADFVGKSSVMAFSQAAALAASVPSAGAADVASVEAGEAEQPVASLACTSTSEAKVDFTYDSQSGFFPENGGRVWVPAQANCAGSYPLIVYLHGCMRQTHATPHYTFGDGNANDIIPVVQSLIQGGKIKPVILAAPSQTKGAPETVFNGVAGSPCTPSLWAQDFDFSRFVSLVEKNLPAGIKVSSVSVMGHSGAGCNLDAGLHVAATYPGLFALGQFDTCSGAEYGASLSSKLKIAKFMAVYAEMGKNRAEQNSAMGLSEAADCPSSSFSVQLKECVANADKSRYAYYMDPPVHSTALTAGTEQFLTRFFANG